MLRVLRIPILSVLLLILSACAALGVDPPQTFNEKAAAAQISVTAARSSALQLLEAGKITAADARNVQAVADAGNAAIDLARQLEKSDPTAAGAKLAYAVSIVSAVQTYLATKGGGK